MRRATPGARGAGRRRRRGRVSAASLAGAAGFLALGWVLGRASAPASAAEAVGPMVAAPMARGVPGEAALEPAPARGVGDALAVPPRAGGRRVVDPTVAESPVAPAPQDAPQVSGRIPETGDEPTASTAPTAIPGARLGGRRMGPPGIRIEGDPSERLAQAREVLADPTAVGRSIGALATLLEQAPEEGRQRVLALLEGEDPGARAAAAAAIWSSLRQEPPLPAATLVEFFERGDGDARFAAASVLAAGGDESLLGRWREERASDLKSAEVATRLRAIRELAQLRDEQTTGLLLPLLSDGSEEVRIAVLRSLSGGRQDRDLVDSLRPLEEDASPRVARAARRLVEDLERRRKRP